MQAAAQDTLRTAESRAPTQGVLARIGYALVHCPSLTSDGCWPRSYWQPLGTTGPTLF